ncbi:MAG: hypothetical protein ACKOS8_14710 [Gemmataceae bacterium]
MIWYLLLLVAAGEAPKPSAVPEDARKALSLSPFYTKHLYVGPLSIVASGKVSDEAMLAKRPDILEALVKNRTRLAVMAPTEQTTDIPEHSDLKPKDYWDQRARGLGATRHRPAVSCAEENLLGLPGDRYPKESILIHEFAHAIHLMALRDLDPELDGKLKQLRAEAGKRELWKGTYADSNDEEYWAEGVQSYFNANNPKDRQHNGIDTREKLKAHDPGLFELIDGEFRQIPWVWPGRPRRVNP